MTTRINVIDRDGGQHAIDWETDQSLMEALRDNDLPVLASCGGTSSCATCHVFLDAKVVDALGAPEEDELELLQEAEAYRAEASRLSCQISHCESLDGTTVTLAPEE